MLSSVKVSTTMPMAHAKMLRESLEILPESMPEDPLYAGLRDGDYESYLVPERREWVDKHLTMLRNERKKSTEKQRNHLREFLYPKKFRNV